MEWERQSPWRQGKFLSGKDLEELAPDAFSEESGAIVASQDCDIAADPETEQFVEFVPFKFVEATNGNRLNAKNPRFLQLPLECPKGAYVEADTRCRVLVDKAELIARLPCADWEMSPMSVNVFQKWLALRYMRSAFPDSFNIRLGDSGRKNITKPIEKTAESIEVVLFDLDDFSRVELDDGNEPYPLTITLVYNDEVIGEAKQLALDAAKAIEKNLIARFQDKSSKEWKGIELHGVEVKSIHAITLYDAEKLLRFDLDDLSFKKDLPASTVDAFEAVEAPQH